MVIPADLRKKVGLKPGMDALIYAIDNEVIVSPVPEDPIEAMCGMFNDPEYSYVEALLKDRREEREREEKELARSVRPAVVPDREDGFESVRSLLRSARASGELLLINDINFAEVFYSRARRTSLLPAENFLASVPTLPLEVVGNSLAEIMDAARLKAQYPIALGDAFAVATALRLNAAIYTADKEFRALAKLVEVRPIRHHP